MGQLAGPESPKWSHRWLQFWPPPFPKNLLEPLNRGHCFSNGFGVRPDKASLCPPPPGTCPSRCLVQGWGWLVAGQWAPSGPPGPLAPTSVKHQELEQVVQALRGAGADVAVGVHAEDAQDAHQSPADGELLQVLREEEAVPGPRAPSPDPAAPPPHKENPSASAPGERGSQTPTTHQRGGGLQTQPCVCQCRADGCALPGPRAAPRRSRAGAPTTLRFRLAWPQARPGAHGQRGPQAWPRHSPTAPGSCI